VSNDVTGLTVQNLDGTRPAVQISNTPTTVKGLPALAVAQGDSTGPAIAANSAGTLLDLRNTAGTVQFKVDNSGTLVAGSAQGNLSGLPSDNALLAATCDVAAVASANITTAGTVYLGKIFIRQAITATNIVVIVSTPGNNTNGSTGTFVGLFSSAGTLLSGSSDCAASLTSAAAVSVALTTPQALAATSVWAAIVTNLGTTQPTLRTYGANSGVTANAGLAAATFRAATNGTSQTALSSVTPGSNASGLPFWFGIT
jgi:hypothetical protein